MLLSLDVLAEIGRYFFRKVVMFFIHLPAKVNEIFFIILDKYSVCFTQTKSSR